MASTASDVQAQAAVDAWLNSQAVKDMQTSINDAYNAGVAQANTSNEQIINTLNKNITDYQNQYQKDAKAAYLNKMQGDLGISNQLARLGLTNSGYGASQYLQNNATYSQNLTGLQNALNQNIANVDLQKNNQALNYQGILQGLIADRANQNYDYNKYLSTTAEEIRQNEIANQLQQQYYDYLWASMNSGGYGGGSGSSGGYSIDGGSDVSGSTSGNSSGVYTSLTDVVKAAKSAFPNSGISLASDADTLIKQGYINKINDNGKVYYTVGTNPTPTTTKKTTSSSTGSTTAKSTNTGFQLAPKPFLY